MNMWQICVAVGLFAVPALAAEPAANPGLAASAAGVRDEAHARDLRLARFDVVVTTRGAVADSEVTARFTNASNDILEGDFTLALPKGAIVTGYALDIGDKMVAGVLVDRPRAEAVYEERVRRRVDPGLAEVANDGQFKTRVFPIPAHGGRTIRVRFTAPIGPDGYRLPLHFDAPTGGWTIVTERLDGAGGTESRSGTSAYDGAVMLKPVTAPPVLASRHRSGEIYLQLSGDVPARPVQPVEHVRIYWDASRSRRDDRHEAEFALLATVLGQMKSGSIEVVTFNSSGADRIVVADADAAIERLRNVRYRGATSFAPLSSDKVAADRCLLFSDGRVTIDRGAGFAPRCRLDAVTSSVAADFSWLRHLATGLGGQAFALADNGPAIARGITDSAASVGSVTDSAGHGLAFIPLESGTGRWAAIVRAPDDGDVLVSVNGAGQRFAVPGAIAFDGEAALLATDTLATLGGTDQRAAYLAVSRRYGVASPSLSFVVLETPADYLAAAVEPPASYPPDWLADYRRMAKQEAVSKAERAKEWTNAVAVEWQSQVSWWKTRFDPAARPVESRQKQAGSRLELPPPPAVAAPAPAVMVDAGAGDIVVTGVRRSGAVREMAAPVAVVESKNSANRPTIAIDAWQPDRAYLKVFDAAPASFDRRFDAQEAKAGDVPAFYLDTAEWLRRQGRMADAIEMVLAALELPSANEVTLGIVADRLERYGAIDRAIELRERHAALDPDRPQPKRLLALALARRARLQPAHARADLSRAIGLLAAVALTPTDARWDGIGMIALMEANALIPRLRALGGKPALDPRFIALLDTDVRVVVDWTTAATDIDLWVDEPSGERAIYNNPRTAIGGRLSHDMTQGYGPEEYLIHRAPPGVFTVRANVYAADRIDPNGLSLMTAHLIRDFGRATERAEAVDIELKRDEKGEKMIGRLEVGAPQPLKKAVR